ncbi:hypothetical protein FRC00_008031 [Tulasnella sp. 408]|nr:hypothetical protein FRC00_008031 [Tulasnella sp. 408]
MKKPSKAPSAKLPPVPRLPVSNGHPTQGSLGLTASNAPTGSDRDGGSRRRRRSKSASEDEGPTVAPPAKRARFRDDGSESEGHNDRAKPPGKRKNAKKKARNVETNASDEGDDSESDTGAAKKKSTKKRASVAKAKSSSHQDDDSGSNSDADDSDRVRGRRNPPISQAMDDLVSQLPPSSHSSDDASPESSGIHAMTQDFILSVGQGLSPSSEEAIQTFHERWKEVAGEEEGILQYMEGRSSKSDTESYHNQAFLGKALLDWLNDNTVPVQGVVNNRASALSHAKSIVRSLKAFGPQCHEHPIIAIVRRSDLPNGFRWKKGKGKGKEVPTLTFASATVIGILAGAHRLMALRLYCAEADKVIKAAEEFISSLEDQLNDASLSANTKSELQSNRAAMQKTLEKVVEDRNLVAQWPTLIYDWDLILAESPAAQKLRDELSKNYTLARRDANSSERLAQLWRLSQKHGKDGSNNLKPGPERVLWKCTETWRPYLGRVAQFPALQSEIGGQIKKYAAFASESHWPGAAIFVLLHSLSGLEALFAPVPDLPNQPPLPPEYWKQLLTPGLAKALGECLTKDGRDLLHSGDLAGWRRQHAKNYWAAVAEVLESHFPLKESGEETSTQATLRNALAGVLQQRLNVVKQELILPLYSKELRQSVFAWFHLAAPGFYAVGHTDRRARRANADTDVQIADMIDTNWFTFSSNADMWAYDDAGSHVVRCLQARATVQAEVEQQAVDDFEQELTRYIIKALYEPCWVSLSAWLGGAGAVSDALNGVMKPEAANEGVNEANKDTLKVVQEALKALKPVTGPEIKTSRSKKAEELINDLLRGPKFSRLEDRKMVEDVLKWWKRWTHLGHVDLRKEWASPMNAAVIERMAHSFHRTTSSPTIWNRILDRPEFETIFCIFKDVPKHRGDPEELLGWGVGLPWAAEDREPLRRSEFVLNCRGVDDHREICLRGYSPLELKVKGRRGGQPAVITSVDHLPSSRTPPTSDPFGIGIPVPPNMTFWAYLNAYCFLPNMWPTYTSWPQLKAAMDAWQKRDLEVLELILDTCPELLSCEDKAWCLWLQATRGWQGLAIWCMAQLTAEDGMQSAEFRLPDVVWKGSRVAELFLCLAEPRNRATPAGGGAQVACGPHFARSEAMQRLHKSLPSKWRDYDWTSIDNFDESNARIVGQAMLFVGQIKPPVESKSYTTAVMFYIFLQEEMAGESVQSSDIRNLLDAYNRSSKVRGQSTYYKSFQATLAHLHRLRRRTNGFNDPIDLNRSEESGCSEKSESEDESRDDDDGDESRDDGGNGVKSDSGDHDESDNVGEDGKSEESSKGDRPEEGGEDEQVRERDEQVRERDEQVRERDEQVRERDALTAIHGC